MTLWLCHLEVMFSLTLRFTESISLNAINSTQQGWRSGESARLPSVCPEFHSRTRRCMWFEFVVGSLPCSERFFSGYSGSSLSSKTNISKFQFDPDYCQAFHHKHLAWVIAQVLLVFDIKFAFTFFFNSDKGHENKTSQDYLLYT